MQERFFAHNVYFWLKRPGNPEDRERLIEGLRKLSAVNTIRTFHIGSPAATDRDVIERTYAVAWCTTFRDKADQDSYQTDPIHLAFVRDCSALWEKVLVYDSEAV
jgi:hypothetical protein